MMKIKHLVLTLALMGMLGLQAWGLQQQKAQSAALHNELAQLKETVNQLSRDNLSLRGQMAQLQQGLEPLPRELVVSR